MNIPTNKLKDLISVLSTLDPDIEHGVESVEVTCNNKRAINFILSRDKYVIFEDFLDSLYEELPSHGEEICEDIDTPRKFINRLCSHLSTLHGTIEHLEKELEETTSRAGETTE